MRFANPPKGDETLDDAGQASNLRKIIFTGGFSSGKSAAINLALRSYVCESDVGLQERPLNRFIERNVSLPYGARAAVTDPPETIEQLSLSALSGLEIVEMPANIDGEFDARFANEFTDASLVIWCTIGSQAWRLSEKFAVEKIRALYSGPLHLAVTRSDLFRSKGDLAKVRARLQGDRSDLFSDIVFLSASRSNIDGSMNASTWEASGGHRLANLMKECPAVPRVPGRRHPSQTDQRAKVIPLFSTASPGDIGSAIASPDDSMGASELATGVTSRSEMEIAAGPSPAEDAAAKLAPIWAEISAHGGLGSALVFDFATSETIYSSEIEQEDLDRLKSAGAALLAPDQKTGAVLDASVTLSNDIISFHLIDGADRFVVALKVAKGASSIGGLRQFVKNACANTVATTPASFEVRTNDK